MTRDELLTFLGQPRARAHPIRFPSHDIIWPCRFQRLVAAGRTRARKSLPSKHSWLLLISRRGATAG